MPTWNEKLSATDYRVEYEYDNRMQLVIVCQKLALRYPVEARIKEAILRLYGTPLRSAQIIEYCIEKGHIPHPFEEYVTSIPI